MNLTLHTGMTSQIQVLPVTELCTNHSEWTIVNMNFIFVCSQRLHLSSDGKRALEKIYVWTGPPASMVTESNSWWPFFFTLFWYFICHMMNWAFGLKCRRQQAGSVFIRKFGPATKGQANKTEDSKQHWNTNELTDEGVKGRWGKLWWGEWDRQPREQKRSWWSRWRHWEQGGAKKADGGQVCRKSSWKSGERRRGHAHTSRKPWWTTGNRKIQRNIVTALQWLWQKPLKRWSD